MGVDRKTKNLPVEVVVHVPSIRKESDAVDTVECLRISVRTGTRQARGASF